jgi:hypothetical protein
MDENRLAILYAACASTDQFVRVAQTLLSVRTREIEATTAIYVDGAQTRVSVPHRKTKLGLLQILHSKRLAGVLPGIAELSLDQPGFAEALLGQKALPKAEKQPAVARFPCDRLAENLLCLGRPAGAEQRSAEGLADRVVPRRRLVILNR